PAELHQARSEWNDRPGDLMGGPLPLVPDLIAFQARRRPAAPALYTDGVAMSYGELAARADRIAGHLRSLGIGPEALVGICLARGPALIAAVVGIFAAGAGYVPLDPALPAERLGFMVEDSGVSVLLTEGGLGGSVPGENLTRLDVFDLRETEPPAGSPPALLPEHPAYVIYTSGSTGRPKGVVVPHGALALRMLHLQVSEYRPSDRFLHKTTISFDASVGEI